MLFVCYPKCSTCQKAKAFLETNGCVFETRNIKTNNPTYDELKTWQEKSGLPLRRFFNTSGRPAACSRFDPILAFPSGASDLMSSKARPFSSKSSSGL